MNNMNTQTLPQAYTAQPPAAISTCSRDRATAVAASTHPCLIDTVTSADAPPTVHRGLTRLAPTAVLRHAIRVLALRLADRLRVIRTIDVAAACFPEREYKASLTAAQRAMRGMVKAGLLQRYRTDRFQTVYGLTQRGAEWLRDEAGLEAAASVRRVGDMTNPEHRLWAQFLVLCAEARGLYGWTEVELLKHLNVGLPPDRDPVQGPLRVQVKARNGAFAVKVLRPDALLLESDGATWLEVDRSARGSGRAADLRALILSIGVRLTFGPLRRVVLFTRTERIHRRVLALLTQLRKDTDAAPLSRGRRQLRESSDGEFEVWETVQRDHADGRSQLDDVLVGHVVAQLLPTWLPKLRLDGRTVVSTAGWFPDNYLPYRRPEGIPPWPRPGSPLLRAAQSDGNG